jgi:nicotinate-nucleotide adenylyltransferase
MIIIFGGSFDPVHVGHILIARDIRESLEPERVIFIPAYHAPLKNKHSASPEDRLSMLSLALQGEDRTEVSDIEIKRGGISYTAQTLEELSRIYPEGLHLLLGADSVLRLHLWKEPKKVLSSAKLIIADRGGKVEEVRSYLGSRFPELREGKDYLIAKTRRIEVSATEIRKRVAVGKSIRYMVPEAVERYIREKGLYRRV